MATHSSVLAWRIPGTAEPGGLPSMGSHRVTDDSSDLAAAAQRAGENRKGTAEIKELKDQLDHLYMNDEREDDLLAFYYLSISISPERSRLGLLIYTDWEFGHRLHILDKPFLFNWLLLLLLLSHSVMSDSLLPHGLKNDRLPSPSVSPRVCSNSCPLSQ